MQRSLSTPCQISDEIARRIAALAPAPARLTQKHKDEWVTFKYPLAEIRDDARRMSLTEDVAIRKRRLG
jgi:hypothetical protein